MLDSLWIILPLSTVLGFLSGLGTGGGSLLILWLTLVQELPQDAARNINLMFFLPSAVITCLFRRKQGVLNLNKALPAIIAGSIAAVMACYLTTMLDVTLIKRLFGILLLLTGVRELFYRPRKAK